MSEGKPDFVATKPERVIKYEIREALGRMPDVLLYNNPVGVVEVGRDLRNVLARLLGLMRSGRLDDALGLITSTLATKGRMVVFGLAPGSSDLIGIGPGGIFLAIEVKTATGRPSKAQRQFADLVHRYGGACSFCRSAAEAVAVIETMRQRERENERPIETRRGA
jgi:hypothetical protein